MIKPFIFSLEHFISRPSLAKFLLDSHTHMLDACYRIHLLEKLCTNSVHSVILDSPDNRRLFNGEIRRIRFCIYVVQDLIFSVEFCSEKKSYRLLQNIDF